MIECQKEGCGREIKLIKGEDGDYYVHALPATHNAQVPLQKAAS